MKEIIQFCALILFVSIFSFLILYLLPGSSQLVSAGLDYEGEIKTDFSVLEFVHQYFSWLGNVFVGDFGVSEYSQKPVLNIVVPRLLVSILIAFSSMLITIFFALLWSWKKENTAYKFGYKSSVYKYMLKICGGIEYFLLSFIPLTMAVLVLSILSAFRVPLLEVRFLFKISIPILVLVLIQFPHYIRSLSASLDQMSRSSFVDFAYSMGYSHRWVWWREILPNSLMFTMTLSSVQLSYLVGGSIIVEKIFSVPGLGSGLVNSVMTRDRPVVQMIIVLAAVLVGIIHLVFEIIRKCVYGK